MSLIRSRLRIVVLALLSPVLAAASIFLVAGSSSFLGVMLHRQKVPLAVVGVLLYMFLRASGVRTDRMYTWGHELVHLMFAWISGKKVYDFDVSSSGRSGFVVIGNPSTWVFVAPYVFSFYNLAAWAIVMAARRSVWWAADLYLFVAFSLFAMNLEFTVRGFAQHQPDFEFSGRMFSGTLVVLCTILWVPFMLFPASELGWKDLGVAYYRWFFASFRVFFG